MSISSDVRAAINFAQIIRQLKPDIVHTHNPKPGIYGRVVAKLCRTSAIVNTVHGLYANSDDKLIKRILVYTLERMAATCSDVELVQNPEDVDTLLRLWTPRKKLRLLGNGVDIARFKKGRDFNATRNATRGLLGLDSTDLVIGTASRLVVEKGYNELFSAFRKLKMSGANCKLLVIGPHEPDKSDALSSRSVAEAEADGVIFLGMRDDIETLYHALDIFVLASYREGYPRAAMEAATAGLPLVVTNIRGCRQVVEHRVNGLLVEKKDVRSLHSALEELVGDPSLRIRLGKNSAIKSRNDFDQSKQIDLTLNIYQELLNRN